MGAMPKMCIAENMEDGAERWGQNECSFRFKHAHLLSVLYTATEWSHYIASYSMSFPAKNPLVASLHIEVKQKSLQWPINPFLTSYPLISLTLPLTLLCLECARQAPLLSFHPCSSLIF